MRFFYARADVIIQQHAVKGGVDGRPGDKAREGVSHILSEPCDLEERNTRNIYWKIIFLNPQRHAAFVERVFITGNVYIECARAVGFWMNAAEICEGR